MRTQFSYFDTYCHAEPTYQSIMDKLNDKSHLMIPEAYHAACQFLYELNSVGLMSNPFYRCILCSIRPTEIDIYVEPKNISTNWKWGTVCRVDEHCINIWQYRNAPRKDRSTDHRSVKDAISHIVMRLNRSD